ncbi:dephospho-CoA kinase [Ascidiaceihabitans sp.]|uniref:dephospho-CoA kinase n=1 Tax=Ascidiaceihabitans sp. TaxID=1872644 RepID=UPI003299CA4E
MFKLGLTGSIGMGKSTTAQMFQDEGCAVWDADAAVHRLYQTGGAAVAPMALKFPEVVENDAVSRDKLRQLVGQNPSVLKDIEQIVHPLLGQDRSGFLAKTTADIVVFDIPLLYETNGDKNMDAVACVFVDDAEQERRVLARGIMSREQFLTIKAKQMPAAEKVSLADYVIHTDTLEGAKTDVKKVVDTIRKQLTHA